MDDLTTCPDCGDAAEVEWRCVLESTDGPIEHGKVRCVRGHWFLLPLSVLSRRVGAPDAPGDTPSDGFAGGAAPGRRRPPGHPGEVTGTPSR